MLVATRDDILTGWHEAFQWQWNATLSLTAFILAYPLTPQALSARQATNSAISLIENVGSSFAIAASAASVTRDLTAKADFLRQSLPHQSHSAEAIVLYRQQHRYPRFTSFQ